ncbi:MAG: hypothetical protein COB36_11115 [Alphaproteobacteria bacterium]|nr:MAG: hypothetical protein COB36_11115 [Alphaproteobacteria bacterium]
MFNIIKSRLSEFRPVHYIVCFMAVALQIQITLFADAGYLGLRVGSADVFLPFIGLYILCSLLTKKSYWPRWSMSNLILWLVALTFVMSIALLNGYLVNGYISSWAFINKYIGFFLLLSYLMLGGWVVRNSSDAGYILRLFMSAFTGFFVITMLLSSLMLFMQYFIPFSLWLPDYPWDGFMANRNAYMVMFILSFIFVIWGYAEDKPLIPNWVNTLFWLCLPIFFIFNDSRTGWIISVVLAIILFLKTPLKRAKSILPILLIGASIAYASYYVTSNNVVLQSRQMRNLLGIAKGGDVVYMGDQKRYIAIEDGLELYHKYNPVLGAGLGSYRPFQIEKRGEFIEIIDFTGLWLLVETGGLGVLVFAAFFLCCMWSLYRVGFVSGRSNYHRAMFTFLIMFAVMSLLHELMYTRVLWFAMGLSLAKISLPSPIPKPNI